MDTQLQRARVEQIRSELYKNIVYKTYKVDHNLEHALSIYVQYRNVCITVCAPPIMDRSTNVLGVPEVTGHA
jgi:predicted PilT family ATPase